jgi:hypothetical protein
MQPPRAGDETPESTKGYFDNLGVSYVLDPSTNAGAPEQGDLQQQIEWAGEDGLGKDHHTISIRSQPSSEGHRSGPG